MKRYRIHAAALAFVSGALAACWTVAATPATPDDLFAIIAKEQVRATGYSTGFEGYDCFTELQRERWEATRGWLKVADRVNANPRFRAVVEQIAAMEPSAREALLTKAAWSRRPTYAEAIPRGPHKDGHSTTDAGAYVESVIARNVVDVVRSTLAAENQEKRNVH